MEGFNQSTESTEGWAFFQRICIIKKDAYMILEVLCKHLCIINDEVEQGAGVKITNYCKQLLRARRNEKDKASNKLYKIYLIQITS